MTKNNKEIKFRVWDIDNKVYYKSIWGLSWKIGGIRFFWDDYKDSDGETMVTDLLDKKYELMQYTGLKDKNGKEIYEGDIVKYNNDLQQKAKVVYQNEFACFGLRDNDNMWQGQLGNKSIKEVIGNIYENPNLLKQ